MLTSDDAYLEIDRLNEELAALRASSGYEMAIAQLEIERLQAIIARYVPASDVDPTAGLAP